MENFFTDAQIHGYSVRRSYFTVRFIAFFSILLYSGSFLTAQDLSTSSKKAKKLYLKADKSYKERDFYSAIQLLEESVKEDIEFHEAYLRMGSLYTAIAKPDSAFRKFQKYIAKAPSPLASVLEKLAQSAFDRGLYRDSEDYLNQFLKMVPERGSSPEIQLLLNSLEFVREELDEQKDSIKIKKLPNAINNFRLQYLPSVTIDTGSIFFTKRDDVNGDEDIVVSHYRNGRWQPAESVSPRINSKLNEGACSVSADGRTMIFTSCDGRNSVGSCDLYITKRVGDQWSYPKNLGKPVNSIYWESQPSLSADGKTLYFSSNRRGGYGGRDIWVTQNINGKWCTPVNIGESINSQKDETTPFIHPNGTSLYFSANGYPGMGGYDLFVSEKADSIWSTPENLGYPINTFRDEVSIVLSSDGSSAYFAKENKKGHTIEDSRIVKTELPDQVQQSAVVYITGKVVDAKTKKPLASKVEVIDLRNEAVLYQSESDSITGQYYMVLPADLELAAYVKKKGYLFSDFHFTTYPGSLTRSDTIYVELEKVEAGKKIVLENIYFDTDSYQVNEKSQSDLKSVFTLLKENPSIVVEIAGHTDNVGNEIYNAKLSARRAAEIQNRLFRMGIERDRIVSKGYAASQPIRSNDTEKGRQSNRRIEFRVLRMK